MDPIAAAARKARRAFSQSSASGLRALCGEASQDAAVTGDPDRVRLAVVAYSLSKFLEKSHVVTSGEWPGFKKRVEKGLAQAVLLAEAGKRQQARDELDALAVDIDALSAQVGRFREDITAKARKKIAADIYAHGASLGRAAALAGADKAALSTYIGVTRLADKYETLTVAQRLGEARRLLA